MTDRTDRNRPLYMISVAAQLAGVHPQTLRTYEQKGLVTPQRTSGNTRMYSQADIERLELINELTGEGINLAGVCEGMVLGMKAGIDPRLLLEIINSSSGESYSSRVKVPGFILKRDFSGGFKARLQHKDMNLATSLARELRVPTAMANLAREYYLGAMARDRGEEDASVIITLLEEITGAEVK